MCLHEGALSVVGCKSILVPIVASRVGISHFGSKAVEPSVIYAFCEAVLTSVGLRVVDMSTSVLLMYQMVGALARRVDVKGTVAGRVQMVGTLAERV